MGVFMKLTSIDIPFVVSAANCFSHKTLGEFLRKLKAIGSLRLRLWLLCN